jgi:hypothetical protein
MDFGIYFQITNNTGATLNYMTGDYHHAKYEGPATIPSNDKPTTVHIGDPDHFEGAEATISFLATINGQMREYTWYGNCPVWSGNNTANGPGTISYNTGGHPLTVTVLLDASTEGWTPWPPPSVVTSRAKAILGKLTGKSSAPTTQVKVSK